MRTIPRSFGLVIGQKLPERGPGGLLGRGARDQEETENMQPGHDHQKDQDQAGAPAVAAEV
jgi:hypothetical protein